VVFLTPDKIDWKPVPAGLPPGAQFAILAGDPTSDGPFVLRLKMPDGYKIAPHRHPVTETTTVLSGELRVGTAKPKPRAMRERFVVRSFRWRADRRASRLN
jgi:hypothetical protein